MLKISQQKLKLEQDMTAADSGKFLAHNDVCLSELRLLQYIILKKQGSWCRQAFFFMLNKLERSIYADYCSVWQEKPSESDPQINDRLLQVEDFVQFWGSRLLSVYVKYFELY